MLRLTLVVALMGLSGLIACDKVNNLTDVPDKMDDLGNKMGELKDDLHKAMTLQEISQAIDKMVSADNTRIPDNPAAFVDAANVIADNASALQLVQIVKMRLLMIRNYTPDDSSKVHGEQPTDLVDKLTHDDKASITALEAILMQVPQAKIVAMVNAQIPRADFSGGLYEDWVYPALALRAMGIWGYMWTVDLHDTMNNMAQFEEAFKLADSIEYIMRQPFVANIKLANLPLPDGTSVTYDANDINLVNAPEFWNEIKTAVTTQTFKSKWGALARYNELNALVASRIKGWTKNR